MTLRSKRLASKLLYLVSKRLVVLFQQVNIVLQLLLLLSQ